VSNRIRGVLVAAVLVLGSAAVLVGVSNKSWSVAVVTSAVSIVVVFLADFLLLVPVLFPSKAGAANDSSSTSLAGAVRKLGPTMRMHVYWAVAVFFFSSAPLRTLGPQAVPAGVVGVIALVGIVWAARNTRAGRTEQLLAAWVAAFLGCLWLLAWIRVGAPHWLEGTLSRLR
jgi:hypothetical protein